MRIRAIALRRSFGNTIEVLVEAQHADHRSAAAVEWHVLRPGEEAPSPTFALLENEAQELMDSLWTAGVRPTEGRGSAGQLGATERHLDDMRRLVFESRPERSAG